MSKSRGFKKVLSQLEDTDTLLRQSGIVIMGRHYVGPLGELVGGIDGLRQIFGEDLGAAAEKSPKLFKFVTLASPRSGYWNELTPGQSVSDGNPGDSGTVRIIYDPFNGGPAGHAAGHAGNYYNGAPPDRSYGPGEVVAYTVGPASGEASATIYPWGFYLTCRVSVGQGTFEHIGSSPNYVLIGGTAAHPSNHWGTPSTNAALREIARRYRERTNSVLYFNDMSLQWGGIFDIRAQWQTPHAEHRNGNVIDIAATATTLAHETIFVEILRSYTTNYIVEGTGTARHYHVRF